MFCNAKTRDGMPCQSTELLRGGRCRLHGGLSTGPKTLEGKRVSAQNIGKDYDELVRIKRDKHFLTSTRARVNPGKEDRPGHGGTRRDFSESKIENNRKYGATFRTTLPAYKRIL